MKIAYDHQIFTSQKYGGISRYFVELSQNLALIKDVEDARIVAPFYRNQYIQESNAKTVSLASFQIPFIPRTGRILSLLNSMLSPVISQSFSPDIVHETYYSTQQNGLQGKKNIITVFDMIHELFPDRFLNKNLSKAKSIAVTRADHVICISENTRRDLVEIFDVDESKTSVVKLGFSSRSFRRNVDIGSPRPFILYVGSRGGYKNFDRLLEAYALHRPITKNYDLIAFGGGEFTKNEVAKIKELGISPVKVRNVQGSDEILAAYYKAAALFIYPSLYEGFGIPPLEAMSFGCPVIASSTSSIPEVVGDAGIFFDPNSAESISRAIDDVLSDSQVVCNLRQKGLKRIEHFSWEKCAQDTLKVYKKVLR